VRKGVTEKGRERERKRGMGEGDETVIQLCKSLLAGASVYLISGNNEQTLRTLKHTQNHSNLKASEE
jgi:hypothetical protein